MSFRSIVITAGFAASLASASCGMNGGDVHGGYHALEPTDQSWTVWYLAPPWVVDMQTTDHATLHVPAFENQGTQPALVHASMALTVDVTTEPVTTALATHGARAMIPGDSLVTAQRPVMFATTSGTEVVIGGSEHEVRIAAAPLAGGRTIVLTFESTSPLSNDAEVTEMIGLVETM